MKNKLKVKQMHLLVIILALVSGCSNPDKAPVAPEPFDHALDIHLNAIRSGNLAELEPTVADSVILIAPNGHRMNSKESFMKLHENWFKRKNWQWTPTFLRTESTDSMGYALIQYSYSEKDSIGNIQFQNKNYLVLIFKKFPKGWQLVHDQNTPVPE